MFDLLTELFEDRLDFFFVKRAESFVLDLAAWINSQKTFTGQIGTAKIVESIVEQGAEIGDFSLIRHSWIRVGARVGAHAHVTRSILCSGGEFPHFNNVGYSIIGRDVLFGSGVSTSSRRLDDRHPILRLEDGSISKSESQLLGAFVGDGSRIGNNCSLNPFTVVSPGTLVAPGRTISGQFPER